MNFFNNCKNEKEAKEVFRNLSKCFHPDKGGNVELMTELNKQYEKWESYANQSNQPKDSRFGSAPVDSEFGMNINYYKMRCESLERELFQTRHHLNVEANRNNNVQWRFQHYETEIGKLNRQLQEEKEFHKRMMEKKKAPKKKAVKAPKRRMKRTSKVTSDT